MKKVYSLVGILCIAFASGIVGYVLAHNASNTVSPSEILAVEDQASSQEQIFFAGLRIDSDPQGIPIALDEQDTGQVTPYLFTSLQPGLHQLRLESDWIYTWRTEVILTGGQNTDLKAQLVQKVGVDEMAADSNSNTDNSSVSEDLAQQSLIILSSEPAAGEKVEGLAIGIPTTEAFEIRITFDQVLDSETAIKSNFAVKDLSSDHDILSEVNYTIGSKDILLKVIPAMAVYPSNTYEVIVKKELRAEDGGELGEDNRWEFNT